VSFLRQAPAVRVVEARPASNLLAEMTGIRHESPQVILFKDGQVVFDADNWDITPEVLTEGFARIPASAATGASKAPAVQSNLKPYLDLLEQYLTGVINNRQFEYVYTTSFRLNSIFGDVDQHLNMHVMMAGQTPDYSVVRQRAEAAYNRLKNLLPA
jgi:hypothetical protein